MKGFVVICRHGIGSLLNKKIDGLEENSESKHCKGLLNSRSGPKYNV